MCVFVNPEPEKFKDYKAETLHDGSHVYAWAAVRSSVCEGFLRTLD